MTAPLEIRADDWLSGLFARPVFQIQPAAGAAPAAVTAALVEHTAGRGRSFYYAKVAASDVAIVSALASVGMRVVDVNVTLAVTPPDVCVQNAASPGVEIREASALDEPSTLAMAEREYQVTRFHLDPHVPDALANTIKREWVANYFAGRRGEQLWVAVVDGRIAGFLAVIASARDGRRVKTIDLIAVTAAFRRRGIGAALVAFFLQHYASECDRLEVGTQVANAVSIRMYERAGFRTDRAAYVLHLHLN